MKKYKNRNYFTTSRLLAYIEQYKFIDETTKNILEIGVGASIFKSIVLAIVDIEYVSVDNDTKTKPTVITSVTKLPFANSSFDIVYCCQVLEHLPFERFENAIAEIIRVARKKIVISLPDNRRSVGVCLKIPKIEFKKVITLLKSGKDITFKTHGQHYWEIGSHGLTERDILNLLKKHCVSARKIYNYRLYERPYQHFFIINKFY